MFWRGWYHPNFGVKLLPQLASFLSVNLLRNNCVTKGYCTPPCTCRKTGIEILGRDMGARKHLDKFLHCP